MNKMSIDDVARKYSHQLTDVESRLLLIEVSPSRLKRFVLIGDAMAERSFYEYMAAIGKIYYQGDMPCVTMGIKSIVRQLKKLIKKKPGLFAIHAAELRLKRSGYGFFGNIKAALSNYLPWPFYARHSIDIIMLGDMNTINQHIDELGYFVSLLEKKRYIKPGVNLFLDGKLRVSSNKPLKLTCCAEFYEVLQLIRSRAADIVSSHPYQGSHGASGEVIQGDDDQNINPVSGFPNLGVNPASGLPMMENSMIDVGGNTYGSDNTQHYHDPI